MQVGLAEAAIFYDRLAAEIARGRLAAAGIAATLFDDGIASLIGGGISGVRVMVAEADADAARALLTELP